MTEGTYRGFRSIVKGEVCHLRQEKILRQICYAQSTGAFGPAAFLSRSYRTAAPRSPGAGCVYLNPVGGLGSETTV